jgi:dihydrofolate reductase
VPSALGVVLARLDAMLMGRRTYEWFAARWPSRSGELADRLNSMPRPWDTRSGTTRRSSRATCSTKVTKLKRELGGEIVLPGSFHVVRTLMEHDLVDELRLKIFPIVLGAGERLLGDTSDSKGPAPRRRQDPRRSDRVPHLAFRRSHG